MESTTNRARRILAYVIDMAICYIPVVLFTLLAQIPFLAGISFSFAIVGVITFFAVFILRDYLFGGRSIGKRLFKLYVVDAASLSAATAKQLIVKNLFLFLTMFDILFFIVSGRSLGERATSTAVLHAQQLPGAPTRAAAPVKKRIAVAAAIVLCVSVPMALVISLSLGAAKKQENYRVAHAYLLGSEAFAQTQAEESQVTLTGYSSSVRTGAETDPEATVVAFIFLVRGQQFQVVCHPDGEQWYVCSECTAFQ